MESENKIPWIHLFIMSAVTFLAILSELAPAGVLIQMSKDLNVSYDSIGNLISIYAIASAIGTIPLVALTVEVNRKKLLSGLLLIFGLSNAVICVSSNFTIILISRLIGGIAAGILWPMISAYAIRLVPEKFQGRAIAITMSGSTLGLGIGMPILSNLGIKYDFRVPFIVLTALIFIVMFSVIAFLPSINGEKKSVSTSPSVIIKNKGIKLCLILTFAAIMAQYAIYTYISPLAISIDIYGGLELATKIFGIGTILSVILAGKFIDSHLVKLSYSLLIMGIVSFVMIIVFKGTFIISHLAFFLWGISFGALVPIFQAEVSKQVETGKDVATALQSSTFNFGIVFGSFIGGKILIKTNVISISYFSIVLLVISIFVMHQLAKLINKES